MAYGGGGLLRGGRVWPQSRRAPPGSGPSPPAGRRSGCKARGLLVGKLAEEQGQCGGRTAGGRPVPAFGSCGAVRCRASASFSWVRRLSSRNSRTWPTQRARNCFSYLRNGKTPYHSSAFLCEQEDFTNYTILGPRPIRRGALVLCRDFSHFSMQNFTKAWRNAGEWGDFSPCVCWCLPGKSVKNAMLFRGKITQKRGAVLGNQAVFCPGCAGFRRGNRSKIPCFFGTEFHKSVECCRGMVVIFSLVCAGVCRGNRSKTPCFFEAKLHKSVGSCWEIRRFFSCVGWFSLGDSTKVLCFFDAELYNLRSAVGEWVVIFCPGSGQVFCWENSTKSLCFFDVKLYKIMECWRGRG